MVVVVESEFCTSSSLALAEGVGAATHTVNMMKSPNVDGILQVRQTSFPLKKMAGLVKIRKLWVSSYFHSSF